jgi:hypothetical protein
LNKGSVDENITTKTNRVPSETTKKLPGCASVFWLELVLASTMKITNFSSMFDIIMIFSSPQDMMKKEYGLNLILM